MLDKQVVIDKMKEHKFIVYAYIGKTKIQFISSHMYDIFYKENTSARKRIPIINIIVDLEKDEFVCIYNVSESLNTLNTPSCGSFLNDEHFDSIVSKFEVHAKWLERITL